MRRAEEGERVDGDTHTLSQGKKHPVSKLCIQKGKKFPGILKVIGFAMFKVVLYQKSDNTFRKNFGGPVSHVLG